MTDDTPKTEASRALLDLRMWQGNRQVPYHEIVARIAAIEAEAAAQAEARVAHLLVCRCPERPRCRPHHDDGVHQWLDLCDLPHEHGEPVVSRAALTPPASEPRNVVPHPAHVPEGSRTHVISWSNVGRHCNVPDCEVNRSGEREGGHG